MGDDIAGPVVICDCETQCPGAPECGCLEIIGPPRQCLCTCNGFPINIPTTLKAEDSINLTVRGKEVGAVAELLDRATSADVLVPAAMMRNRVTVRLEAVSFADAVEQLGLVLRPPDDSAY